MDSKPALDVWIAFFDRTDGRDKLAKALQNYFRASKHYALAGSAQRVRAKKMQDSLSEFRSWIKFFKWLGLYRDFRDTLNESRKTLDGVGAATFAELVAIGADSGYKLGDNVELLSTMRFLPFDPERCERASKTCQFVAYTLDLLLGLNKLQKLRARAAFLRRAAADAAVAATSDASKGEGADDVKRLQIAAVGAERKAQLALLWSLADLADWLRVTPGFCGMHGNAFGLRKHDGFSGVMGALVGVLGCFKVYLKCR